MLTLFKPNNDLLYYPYGHFSVWLVRSVATQQRQMQFPAHIPPVVTLVLLLRNDES